MRPFRILALSTAFLLMVVACDDHPPAKSFDEPEEYTGPVTYGYEPEEDICSQTRLMEFDDLAPGIWERAPEASYETADSFDCDGTFAYGEEYDADGYWMVETEYSVHAIFWSAGDSPMSPLPVPPEGNWLDNYNGVEFRDTRSTEGWDESHFISWSHLNGELRGVWFTATDDNLRVTIGARIPTTEDGKVTFDPQPECERSPDTECPTMEEAQEFALTEYDDQVQAELEAFVLGVASDLQRELRIE